MHVTNYFRVIRTHTHKAQLQRGSINVIINSPVDAPMRSMVDPGNVLTDGVFLLIHIQTKLPLTHFIPTTRPL